MHQSITIALAGQPNVGKSSIINKISGSNLKVGNFAGVTIEKAEAKIQYKGYTITIIDLPGTYSLNQYTPEEKVTQDFLLQGNYDLILNIVDSTNLERNLAFTAQLLELDQKILLALNMNDEAQKEGININSSLLSGILGIPVLKVTSRSQNDMLSLLDSIITLYENPKTPSKRIYNEIIEEHLSKLEHFFQNNQNPDLEEIMQKQNISSLRNLSIHLLKQDQKICTLLAHQTYWAKLSMLISQSIASICQNAQEYTIQEVFTLEHYAFAKGASLEVQQHSKNTPQDTTQKIDSILLNKYLGIPIFLLLMWLLFQATFTLGAIPKDEIENGFAALGEFAKQYIPNEEIASLIADGIIAGVGAVVSFLPDILILFFGIVLLESTGYMARIAFLLDGFFHRFGLHGKSFIPLVTGFGCSVPAYMSTRMLKNRGDKMLTLFIINFMSCSARLPVYILFIGAFFPASQSGNILFAIYIFGAIVGLIMAKILKLTAFRGVDEPFVMEMPKYRLPSSKLVILSVWNKAKMYLKKAGTFILLASMAIWFAQHYPHNAKLDRQIQSQIDKLQMQEQATVTQEEQESLQNQIALLDIQKKAMLQEESYLGQFGKLISPIFKPFDFDWKLSVSLVTGIAAKEVMLSTMGVLYSIGEVDDDVTSQESQRLMEVLKKNISIPSVIAFLMFVMFYNPCFAASIVFGKEAGGRRFTLYLFVFTSVVAYCFALLGYSFTQFLF